MNLVLVNEIDLFRLAIMTIAFYLKENNIENNWKPFAFSIVPKITIKNNPQLYMSISVTKNETLLIGFHNCDYTKIGLCSLSEFNIKAEYFELNVNEIIDFINKIKTEECSLFNKDKPIKISSEIKYKIKEYFNFEL